MSIGGRLDETGGRPSGFDYLRLALAVMVMLWHTVLISYGDPVSIAWTDGWVRPFKAVVLPMFFSLSGFLVAGSLARSKTLVMFLGLRAIRIFPALAVEVVLSALIIGAVLTTKPLGEYFGSPTFFSYFWNIVGHIHYALPGVFQTNPHPGPVNGQLWTVPYELYCYIAISGLALIGAAWRRGLFVVSILALTGAGVGAHAILHPETILKTHGVLPGWLLVISFLLGVAIYLYRDRLAWSHWLGALTGVVGLALLAAPMGQNIAVYPLAYFTVWLGLLNPARNTVVKGADYSYGIFLYGYVIQQAFASFGAWTHHWWLNALVCVPVATAFAAFSWHVVEKPAMGWRRHLVTLERAWLASPLRPLATRVLPQRRAPEADLARPPAREAG